MRHLQDQKICIVADREGMIYFIDVGNVTRDFSNLKILENAND